MVFALREVSYWIKKEIVHSEDNPSLEQLPQVCGGVPDPGGFHAAFGQDTHIASFSQDIGPNVPLRSLPIWTVLWFHDPTEQEKY